MALTSDSPRFTLPPGRVQSLNPTAWRTNSTLCSASSIQAMTDTSLVGRVLAIFGRGLGIRLLRQRKLGLSNHFSSWGSALKRALSRRLGRRSQFRHLELMPLCQGILWVPVKHAIKHGQD